MRNAPKNAFPLLPHNSQQIREVIPFFIKQKSHFCHSIIDEKNEYHTKTLCKTQRVTSLKLYCIQLCGTFIIA